MSKFDEFAGAAGRLIRNVKQRASRELARSDEIVERAKTEATTRRRMMDAALKERRTKRGK